MSKKLYSRVEEHLSIGNMNRKLHPRVVENHLLGICIKNYMPIRVIGQCISWANEMRIINLRLK